MGTKKISVIIVYGGCLAQDVAEQIEALKPDDGDIEIDVTLRCASERPKTLLKYKTDIINSTTTTNDNIEGDGDAEKKKEDSKTTIDDAVLTTTTTTNTIVCFVLQTIEHGLPTEEGGLPYDFSNARPIPLICYRVRARSCSMRC